MNGSYYYENKLTIDNVRDIMKDDCEYINFVNNLHRIFYKN